MRFCLLTLGLYFVILKGFRKEVIKNTEIAKVSKPAQTCETIKTTIIMVDEDEKGYNYEDEKDYNWHGKILSASSKEIYNIFFHTKTSVELWEALENKYNVEDINLKQCSSKLFLDFQIVEGKLFLLFVHVPFSN